MQYYHVMTILMLLFALCHFSPVHSSLFRKIPSDQYMKLQGLDIELPCVTDQRDVSCFWLKNGTVINPIPSKYKYFKSSRDGDCSLTIYNLNHAKDSTSWVCQVPSFAEVVDNIQWPKTVLVVLVKPSQPKIHYDKLNSAITAEWGSEITCMSDGGNPPPLIEWHLNGDNITHNATISIKDTTIYSTLRYSFKKSNNGSTLSCVSVHPTGTQKDSQILDVLYKPHVTVSQKSYTVSDGQSLEIDCSVDANPPASAYWKPNVVINQTKYRVSGNKLILDNINHLMDGVMFQCSAQNSVGTSEPESVKLNVLFKPRLIRSSPLQHKINLGSDLRLECNFIGNPKPVVRWVFVDSIKKELVYLNSVPENPGLLHIKNISYTNEGGYHCEATNHNSLLNTDNIALTNKFQVDIVGKPAFIKTKHTVIGYRGLNTRVDQTFCSDPFPTKVYWSYGSMKLEVYLDLKHSTEEFPVDLVDGFHIKAGRLVNMDPLSPNPTCFSAALMVSNTDIDDKRDYVLVVKNIHGISEGVVTLQVYSQLSGAAMISISLIILLMFFILTIVVILFLRRRSANNQNMETESKPEGGGSFL